MESELHGLLEGIDKAACLYRYDLLQTTESELHKPFDDMDSAACLYRTLQPKADSAMLVSALMTPVIKWPQDVNSHGAKKRSTM